MAYLAGYRKEVLVRVAGEIGEELSGDETVVALKQIIVNSANYEEDVVRELAEATKLMIFEERERQEREQERERERQEREQERERERQEREQERERERQEREQEKERERAHEIEKLRITVANSSRVSIGSTSTVPKAQIQIKNVMDRFKGENDDITMFLSVFEAQIEQLGIPESEWVTNLMALLPNQINSWLMLNAGKGGVEYEETKARLLEMYKFNAEKFRQLFTTHQKRAGTTWNVYARELSNYCKEWVAGLKITEFQELLDLMVTDQLKRRVPAEMRDHFIDEWGDMAVSLELAKKLDSYENNRAGWKRNFSKYPTKDSTPGRKAEKATENTPPLVKERKDVTAEFERPRVASCYKCGEPGHFRRNCPNKSTERVNHVAYAGAQEMLRPFTCDGTVNEHHVKILRDSGATFDVVSRRHIRNEHLTGESVWVMQPLDEAPTNLPVARVTLEGPFGKFDTKAAVAKDNCGLDYYILSNRTATLMDEVREGFVEPQLACAVQTRSQTRVSPREGSEETDREGPIRLATAAGDVSEVVEDALAADESEEAAPEVIELLKIDTQAFATAQQEDEEVNQLMELVRGSKSEKNGYFEKGGLLFRARQSKRGERYEMIVMPRIYRATVLKVCHETANAHLGVTKSKDSMAKYFYWPNCFKDMENYVRTCDSCQKVGRSGDKKRAPLKLVPVVSEVFTKINIDACGPFPESKAGNKYILTAICCASKFPEAVPITDLSSVTVIEALLELFSRIGFPRELQTDQGSSFKSSLTAEFAERFGIRLVHSSPYHPQSNPVERIHRTMNRLMKVLCLEAGTEWEKQLPAIMFALRTTVHESLGFSPAELVYGRNLRTPITLMYEHLAGTNEETSPVVEHVFRLINRLKRSKELAHQRLVSEQEKRKVWYDRKAIQRRFFAGERVLVLAPNKTQKLAVQWVGPGEIIEQISETNYVVQMPGKKDTKVYHVNMLKRYHQRTEYVNFLGIASEGTVEGEDELDRYALKLDSTDFDIEKWLEGTEVEPEFRAALEKVIYKYKDIFSEKPGLTDVITMDVELTDHTQPVRRAPYKMSPRQTNILKEEITKMLKEGIIEVGESDYTSPMILVEAPGKKPRPCIDYRRLNEIIKTEYYPLPNMDERIETVAAAKIITTLDLAKCYWQIGLTARAQRYAAFVTSFGTYRPLRLPFGIKNGPYQCSRMMASLLRECQDFALPYLDDIAIFSNTWQEHVRHLDTVFNILQGAKLTVQPAKCKYARKTVQYLGYVVGSGELRPVEAKVKVIREFPTPKTKKQVRAFLGLAGYYRKFIHAFAEKAAPLSDLLRGRDRQGRVTWTDECEKAFCSLREALCGDSVVKAPDFSRPFILQADASDRGLGIILAQKNDLGDEHPILYLSRKLTQSESKYCVSERECLGLVYGLQKLKYYLDGQVEIKIETDHNPLVWLKNTAGNNPRLMRWSLLMQQYDITIVHKKGAEHVNVDALSRMY